MADLMFEREGKPLVHVRLVLDRDVYHAMQARPQLPRSLLINALLARELLGRPLPKDLLDGAHALRHN